MRRMLPLLLLAAAAAAKAERLPFEAFTTANGLAQDWARRIVPDADGFLWVATTGGLSQFDGNRFANFGPRDGLRGPAVYDVAFGSDGTGWVATEAGLFRFRPGEPPPPGGLFREFPLPGVPPTHRPHRLLLGRDGALWVGTFGGLWRLEADEGRPGGYRTTPVVLEPRGPHSRVQALAQDPSGAIWVGTHLDGIYRVLPDGRVEHAPKQLEGTNFVREFRFDRDGGVWIAYFGGVAHFERPPFGDPAARARILGSDTAIGIDISAILPSADDGVLVGSASGVTTLRRDGNAGWRVDPMLDRRSGLPGDQVTSLARDRWGNLWIGLGTRGIVKHVDSGLATLPEFEEAGSVVIDLTADRNGRVVALASTGATALTARQIEGGVVRSHPVSLPRDLAYVGWGWGHKLPVDWNGSWWLASGAGVLRYDDPGGLGAARLRRPPDAVYRRDRGLPGDDVFVVMVDSQGDVWVGSNADAPSSSVSRWSRETGRIGNFSADEIGTEALATRFLETPRGDVWILFVDGSLVRFRDRRFETIQDLGRSEGRIAQIFLDHGGRLWLLGRGVRVEEDPDAAEPRFVPQALGTGMADVQVRCATEDRFGRLWFGTDRGLLRLEPETGKVRQFTMSDGLVGNSIAMCLCDGSGTLWFSDSSGVSRVEPRLDPPVSLAPARLREIVAADESVPLPPNGAIAAGPFTLPPGRGSLFVEFFAVHFGPGPRPRYQFRLEGADADWSAPTEDRTVRFASLAPGRYRFLVRTVTEDGTASGTPAAVSLRVLAPLWRRGWFQALASVALIALVTASIRLRVRRLVALERVRTRIATDLHDDIGSSLSRMAILSEVVRREVKGASPRAAELLGQIADSARGLTESMADIVWSLDPRHDDLGHTIFRVREYAADVLSPSGISWTLTEPEAPERIRLSAERRRHLYLILKEAIHNVFKHSGAGSVEILLEVRGRELRAQIRDDGRGLGAEPAPRSGAVGGHGLENMRARAAQAGGRLEIAAEPGGGTALTLTLPLA